MDDDTRTSGEEMRKARLRPVRPEVLAAIAAMPKCENRFQVFEINEIVEDTPSELGVMSLLERLSHLADCQVCPGAVELLGGLSPQVREKLSRLFCHQVTP